MKKLGAELRLRAQFVFPYGFGHEKLDIDAYWERVQVGHESCVSLCRQWRSHRQGSSCGSIVRFIQLGLDLRVLNFDLFGSGRIPSNDGTEVAGLVSHPLRCLSCCATALDRNFRRPRDIA